MIRHILADGREVDSIEGFVVPCTGTTEAVYHLAAECMRKNEYRKVMQNENGIKKRPDSY